MIADNRSKEQKKQDAKKLAVQRKEDERLKEKEKKWKAEQRRLAGIKAEEEAQEVRQKLLRAQLGPTPTTAGALAQLTCYFCLHPLFLGLLYQDFQRSGRLSRELVSLLAIDMLAWRCECP